MTAPLPSPEEVAIELLLTTAAGQVVTVPEDENRKRAVRIAQNVAFQTPAIQGLSIPRGTGPAAHLIAANYPAGLPLNRGFSYKRQLRIDDNMVESQLFYVPNPPGIVPVG